MKLFGKDQVCLDALKRKWMTWAGHPEVLRCDRGLRNRGVLAQWMSSHGVQVHRAPLESPEAIGRVERRGGVIKGMARKVISQTQAVGLASVPMGFRQGPKRSSFTHG